MRRCVPFSAISMTGERVWIIGIIPRTTGLIMQ